MKKISILGSTGSIGTQTLSVIRSHPDDFAVQSLAVNTSLTALREQVAEFHPASAVIFDERTYSSAVREWPFPKTRLLCGMEGLLEIASEPETDLVVTAMVGMIGLRPTQAAVRAGKTIALANKETLVCAGGLIMKEAAECGAPILPVDSEHGAIFQCLAGVRHEEVERILLTASGGPFRGWKADALAAVTKEQALRHPSWSMGAKITIDSASMVNKALEMIEAHWLFDMPEERIQVVIHPQSIVHSMIELVDGTVMAQLGVADMRLPIQVALAYPQRASRIVERLDFTRLSRLDFESPDEETFRSLGYGREAMRRGGLYPAALNIANEQAVADFLQDRIPFTGIYARIEEALECVDREGLSKEEYSLDDIDALAKRLMER